MPNPHNQVEQIAIIRGVSPEDAVAVTEVFYDAGFDAVEVPLNSPSPLESIRRMIAICSTWLCGLGMLNQWRES